MLNENDLSTWRDEMITIAQAKENLNYLQDRVVEDEGTLASYYMLEEFIKQYEDWVKVKTMTRGVLLKGKDNE